MRIEDSGKYQPSKLRNGATILISWDKIDDVMRILTSTVLIDDYYDNDQSILIKMDWSISKNWSNNFNKKIDCQFQRNDKLNVNFTNINRSIFHKFLNKFIDLKITFPNTSTLLFLTLIFVHLLRRRIWETCFHSQRCRREFRSRRSRRPGRPRRRRNRRKRRRKCRRYRSRRIRIRFGRRTDHLW